MNTREPETRKSKTKHSTSTC